MIKTNRRLVVTGLTGQVSRSLIELSPKNFDIIPLGRPHFELTCRRSIFECLMESKCDAIINAAAYTSVDKAENDTETAFCINAEGAGLVAEAAERLGVPLLHISTDYVFDGFLPRPYTELDRTRPAGSYGRSKLEGERLVRKNHNNSVILRTAWVYSPFSHNFVKTVLRLGETKHELSIVDDQLGNPTYAFDLAKAFVLIAERLLDDNSSNLRGIYHITGSGEGSWADFAEEILSIARRYGRSHVHVKRIKTSDYPTLAIRPTNSRLNNDKLLDVFDIKLPEWQISLEHCVSKILNS